MSQFDLRVLIYKIRKYESFLQEIVRNHPEYKETFERLKGDTAKGE